MRIKDEAAYQELRKRVRANIERLKESRAEAAACPVETAPPIKAGESIVKKTFGAQMTKTEVEAYNMLALEYPHCRITPWGMKFRIAGKHMYSPDFVISLPENVTMLVEVKSRVKTGFRQNSYQRAKLAFDACIEAWPQFIWQFREKQKDGQWEIKTFDNRGGLL